MRFLKPLILWHAARDALVFRTTDLDRPFDTQNEELLMIIGTHLDSELDAKNAGVNVAQQVRDTLKRSAFSVHHRRMVLGISLRMPRVRHWTAAEHKLLGTMPDAVLGRKLNRTTGAIKLRRERKGIRPFQTKHFHWTPAADAIVKRLSPKAAARRLKVSPDAIKTRRWRLLSSSCSA